MNGRVNREFYVDSCLDEIVAMGLRIKVFEVDHNTGWGTPDDYKPCKYRQSFFHEEAWHRLEKEIILNIAVLEELENEYARF